jgi:hypothetical protein
MAKHNQPKNVSLDQPPSLDLESGENAHENATAGEDDGQVPTVMSSEQFEEYKVTRGPTQMFQSESARAAALRQNQDDDDDVPVMGILRQEKQVRTVTKTSDDDKLVRVRPRINMNRFRYGKQWVQLRANKDIVVPKHLANMLEQKGVL